jgi:hypothetical protein
MNDSRIVIIPTAFSRILSSDNSRMASDSVGMGVIREVEMWRSGNILCVLILHEDPQGLIIQVRRQQDVVVSVWCTDPDFAAEEADHWFGKFVTADGQDSDPALDSRDKPGAPVKRSTNRVPRKLR